ncbi:MAG: RNA methyltransferase [Bifidobacterium minimum]|jgi:TrmH family RNA methyltransferase|nr:RNA methyltransferase [Bifidobacterium minimum]
MPVDSIVTDNPRSGRIRKAADLADARCRKRFGRFLVEGPQSVREAVSCAPGTLRDLFVDKDLMAAPGDAAGTERSGGARIAAIVGQAVDAGVYVHPVTSTVMRHLAPEAQGIVGVADMPSPDGAVAGDVSGGLVAAFWQIRDPGNAGAVIRVCDAAGCSRVVFVDECVDPYSPKVVRSTAGSMFHLPIARMGTEEFLDWAHRRAGDVMAADVHGSPERPPESLPDVATAMPSVRGVSVLFGNEARGLPDGILSRVERVVSIPMYGRAESMNLATSAAVMLFTMAMADRGMSSRVGRIVRR